MNAIAKTETTKHHTIVLHDSCSCAIFGIDGQVTVVENANPSLEALMEKAREIVRKREIVIEKSVTLLSK